MLYGVIGLVVGMIMGFTGAGGAMISIPMCIFFLNTSLKEATVLSLVAVILGSSLNLIGQISRVEKRMAIILASSGIAANYASLSLKAATPDWLIALILTSIGVYSILSIWRKRLESDHSSKGEVIPKAMFAGAFVGLLTSLTGLGGGVILVPLLVNFFDFSFEKALPTSLGTVLLISITSLGFQSETAFGLINGIQLLSMAAGTLFAFLILKLIVRKFDAVRILLIRNTLFTVITIYSITSVIFTAM